MRARNCRISFCCPGRQAGPANSHQEQHQCEGLLTSNGRGAGRGIQRDSQVCSPARVLFHAMQLDPDRRKLLLLASCCHERCCFLVWRVWKNHGAPSDSGVREHYKKLKIRFVRQPRVLFVPNQNRRFPSRGFLHAICTMVLHSVPLNNPWRLNLVSLFPVTQLQ